MQLLPVVLASCFFMSRIVAVGAAALLGLGGLAGRGFGQWQGRHAPADSDTAMATAGERKVLYWYDPMVPTQRFDKPGKSPFMDMQLVPRYADEVGAASAGSVAVSAQAEQALGLRVGQLFQNFASFFQQCKHVLHFALAHRLRQVAGGRRL